MKTCLGWTSETPAAADQPSPSEMGTHTHRQHPHPPALLQSTLKLFFWPMKALLRPRPFATTLLASDWPEAPGREQLMARVSGSTVTEDVSWELWLDTSFGPGRQGGVQVMLVLVSCSASAGLTADPGFEGASDDVVRTPVLDGDEVAAGRHRHVRHPVALRTLHTVHLHLGRPVDGHGQSAWTSLAGVDQELTGTS